jgi:mono-ADP-ribosyltransferase sirtuin 6
MALVGLVTSGVVKLVISQNVDGLHMRSGIPRDKLAELHGNLFLETCEVCGWEYLRDFDVGGISFQTTGRFCTRSGCGGALRDTLLDWDDALPEADFLKAQTALNECDLCLCMGTSLRIRPASELPLIAVRNGGKLVICNLQNTPKDRRAHMNIHASVDEVMSGVMAMLSIPIPCFEREIELCTKVQHAADGGGAGLDVSVHAGVGDDCPVPFVETCTLELCAEEESKEESKEKGTRASHDAEEQPATRQVTGSQHATPTPHACPKHSESLRTRRHTGHPTPPSHSALGALDPFRLARVRTTPYDPTALLL